MGRQRHPHILRMTHTILYYTANLISDFFAENIRKRLTETGLPIVSVSHKPIDFGVNICVEECEPSPYNIYRQILIGAKKATTKYVVCCEDDSLYIEEHFTTIPDDDTFYYNVNRWNVNQYYYYYRRRAGMCMCVAPTELMVETLEKRFKKYPDPIPRAAKFAGFGEPGRYERKLGLEPVKMKVFKTSQPTLTFNHNPSLGGKRRILSTDILKHKLEPWGKAEDLWAEIHG